MHNVQSKKTLDLPSVVWYRPLILREAEAGETLCIQVQGQPVPALHSEILSEKTKQKTTKTADTQELDLQVALRCLIWVLET